jgi:large subunit ribosomal protein L25
MAERVSLSLEPRTVLGKKVKTLRRNGLLPATVYGKDVTPISVQLNARTFNDTYRKVGRTTLLDLQIPGQHTLSAFVHAIQRHPVTREILHVDLRAVNLLVEIMVVVPVHITGESPLAARGDAILNVVHNTMNVRALPTDVPSAINVDVSGLDSFEKTIHVGDLELPPNVSLELGPEELLVSLTAARAAEEEPEAVAEGESSAEPELVRERREDEDEE